MPFKAWKTPPTPDLLGPVMRVLVFLALSLALLRRSGWIAAFVLAFAVLGLLPYLSWRDYTSTRYTYAAALGVTGMVALAVDELVRWRGKMWPLVFGTTILASVFLLGAMFRDLREHEEVWARLSYEQARVLRDVQSLDPALPAGAALYFLNSSTRADYTLEMMYDMIDTRLHVGAADIAELPAAAEGAPTNIYYYRDGRLNKATYDSVAPVTPASRALPVRFGSSIDLIGYDVPSTTVTPGQPFIFLPYWRAAGPVGRNYSVFVHLVDKDGERVGQLDSYPQEGRSPTSGWQPGQFIGDYYVLPVPERLPAGELWIEMGLYDIDTMQRLEVMDEAGKPVDQRVRIGPIRSGSH
jgi:hypothetical protein